MTLQQPWWLLALPFALLVVYVVARQGRRVVPARQQRIAVWLRMIGVTLLVLALTQPLLVRSSSERSVLFLLDRSSSVTADARSAQEAFVLRALETASDEDSSAVAVFGSELRLDTALSSNPAFDEVRTIVDSSSTDLAGAMRGAAAVLPTEGSRRIVVLTDAVETTGNARAAARDFADQGIAVDVIQLDTGRASDALVTRIDAPVVVRAGETVPVEVTVQATASGPGTITVTSGDQVFEVEAELSVGTNRVTIEVPAGDTGTLPIKAEVDASFDAIVENNSSEVIVEVLGPAAIALVEGTVGDGAELARALESADMAVDTLAAVPSAAELLNYDAVVLVNVPAPADAQAEDLASFVEDLGRGLLVVGGDNAFGLGDYSSTKLEEILPVTSNPDDLIRRQPVAEVLVIDTSGSMADCHCGGGGVHDPSQQGGVNKTDISRAGAGLAISALQDSDRVGVLAFTAGTRWALPLGAKPDQSTVAEALNSLTPEGDTEITQALRVALDELKDAPEEIRHIVLFTDGWGNDTNLLSVSQEIADAGITLSVLGTGEGSGENLRRAAALGGGQFYPGRDLSAIPDIFIEETLRVARPLIAEGAFLPSLGAASQVTAGLTATPALRGYVLTKSKPTAAVPLELGPGDPLFATWQRGLGRAAVWMSDATTRWSADWVSWEGFSDFWGRMVSDVLPPGRDTPPSVRLDGGTLEIEYQANVPLDAVAIATIRNTEGVVTMIPLQRTDETTFEARVPVPSAGAYWVAVQVEDATGTVASGSGGVVAGYADEFAFRDPDPDLASDIADTTSGRVNPLAAETYDPAPSRGDAALPMWPWLAAVALALFMIDVALRRLVVAKGDFEVWREAVRPQAKQPVQALDTTEAPTRAAEDAPRPDPVAPRREALPEEETLAQLLKRKRKQ
ncbi:MAG: VWA domain-containing protein [Acidimicrobiia bacterium]|nr:VWA domain-containing protein [Acidimicrobiia bacterium]